MLKLKNVSKYYYQDGVIEIGINKVNLEFHIGEFVVITGESGSGKSTLLNVLSGLDTYEDGEMYINGEETSHYREEDFLKYRRKYVSNIFQNFNLINSYTVYENVCLALIMNGKQHKDIKRKVLDLLERVELTKYKNTYASKLSGGQKQKVAIARALASDTPIVVADEPTGNLDSASSREIIKLLHDISKTKLVIVVTHNKREIEKYATRFIKMHDGRVLEDKIIKKINLDKEITTNEFKDISRRNIFKLGIKNAFNIPIKTILMFIIFMLITLTLITSYGIFAASEVEETSYNSNNFFINDSDYRIIVTKKDGNYFTDEDYEKINNLDNIASIYKFDILLDYGFELHSIDYNYYFYGYVTEALIESVDVGRLPNNENEVVIIGNIDDWYLEDSDDILNNEYNLSLYEEDDIYNIKIVGIKYRNDYDYNYGFILSEDLEKDIAKRLNEIYSTVTFTIDNNKIYPNIKINANAGDDEVYISDNYSYYCKNYNCVNKNITINVKNLYEEKEEVLKISKVYTSKNAKTLISTNFEEADEVIYMNEFTYNKLFNGNVYQSSIFVRELKNIEETKNILNSLGYNTFVMKDTKSSDNEILQIIKIFKLIVTIFLIFTLFFIAYFIIKIIYKSRNSYYTTLRSLGSTRKVCTNILMQEFLTLITFTYAIFIILVVLIKKDIIHFAYLKNICEYINFKDYLIVYLILLLLSVLIARRYGRKIFKKSIIKTYGERL